MTAIQNAVRIVRSIKAMDSQEKETIRANFNNESGFFGVPLDHESPILVCDCISFIRNRGFYEVGVFRIPGNLDVVNNLKDKYNQRYKDRTLKEQSNYSVLNKHKPAPSVNDVASLLKAFFTDLTNPLIPRLITKALLEVSSLGLPEQDESLYLGKLIKRIPSPNRECLGLLISFLRELCAFRRFNNMSSDNLATCFVLSVFGRGDPQTQILLVTSGSQIIKKLISGKIRIFMPSVRNVKKNTRYKDEANKEEENKPRANVPAPSANVQVQELNKPPPVPKKKKPTNLGIGGEPKVVAKKPVPELPMRPNLTNPTVVTQQSNTKYGDRVNDLFGGI